MTNDFYVYGHQDSNGMVRYVGKGRRNRAWNFCQRSKKWDAFFPVNHRPSIVLLEENLSEWDAYHAEAKHIARLLDEGIDLINVAAGGPSGWDERSSKLLSEMRQGQGSFWHGKKRDPEVFIKGQKTKEERGTVTRYWAGKKRDPALMKMLVERAHTPEAIAKSIESRKGWKPSEEHRRAISEKLTGKPCSPERAQKISAARKGISTRGSGWKVSDESKAKMSKAATGRIMSREAVEKRAATIAANGGFKNPRAKQVRCVQTGVVFRSSREASKEMFDGVGEKVIQQVCIGKKKGYRGYQFEHTKDCI